MKSAQFAALSAAEAIAADDVTEASLSSYSERWKAELSYHKILRGKRTIRTCDRNMSIMGRCFPEEMGNMGMLEAW